MRVIFTWSWLHTRQDPNAGNSHAIFDCWWGNVRRCVAWCCYGGTARRCVMARCFCRGTARCRGITWEGPRDAVWRGVAVEGPRDARGINGEGPRRVKVVTMPCRLLCHYLPVAQIFLATIWPIEILQSLVRFQKSFQNSNGVTPNGDAKDRRGRVKSANFHK